jgi:fused signal recognition particle receptor
MLDGDWSSDVCSSDLKLDGTARGGILVAIAAKHKLPVYFIGVGEGVDDLEPFEAEDFAAAIAGLPH